MDFDLTQSIVRILQKDGTTAGTGFFISKSGLIATCAHVINGYKSGEEISIVLFSSNEKYQAVIEKEWWRNSTDEDIAILRLLSKPSHDISVIPLGYPSNIENTLLITFGFPASKPVEGLNGRCEVVGRTTENGYPVLQLRSPEVTRGFSGAPVLNPVTNRIIGMVTAIAKPDPYGRQTETMFITPSDVLANVCPEVEEINIERVVRDLKLNRSLVDRFIDLGGQSSTVEDITKQHKKESSIIDQLGLDPIFRLMESSTEEGSRENKILSVKIEDTESFSDCVIEELRKHPRCVLLGEAGAGKTTILEKIVLDASEKYLATKKGVLPVYLKLSSWQTDQSFLDFIYSQWSFASDPMISLNNGIAALYLDGLNEIGSNTKTRLQQLRGWLSSESESKKIIITCRMDDFLIGGLDLNLQIVKIESMEESRIRLFSKKFLDILGKNSEPFISQILPSNKNEKNSSLIKLASNPFTLTALIVYYCRSSDNALPRNKGLLYKKLVETLWNQEETRNWSGWLPYNEMELMLSRLSFYMIDSGNAIEVSVTEALKYCSPEILQIARSANIVKIENEKLKFYHQLMQEFFAAVELKRYELSTKLQRPQIDSGERKDSRWDQVVIALCGISEFPDDIINYILRAQDPYLAAICISSGIQVHESTIKKTIDQLIGSMAVWDWLDSEKRSEVASRAISNIGKPAIPFLIRFFESEEVVLFDRERVAKDVILLAGGAVVGVVVVAAAIAAAPATGSASLFGVIPFATQISKNEHFIAVVKAFKESPGLKHSLQVALEQAPKEIDKIKIAPARKIRLMKLIISVLGAIEDSEANSALQKLYKNDPNKEIREAAESSIARIKAKS